MNFKTVMLASVLAGCSIVAGATNYYASSSGIGNGTSSSSPAALATAIEKLAAGDSLFLLGGQYNLTSKLTISKSGVSADKMTFIGAYVDEKPIFDFRGTTYGSGSVSVSSSVKYLHLKGVTIRYSGTKGLLNYGSNCLFENLDVYGNAETGIQMKNCGGNTIKNCDSHENFDYENLDNDGKCDFGGNADGFADKQYENIGNTYVGCRAWNNSDDGWDFFQRVGGTTVFQDCVCYHNGPQYYDLTNYPRLAADAAWFEKIKKAKTVTTAEGTYSCSIAKYFNNGNGNGFKLGGKSTKHNVTLYRCLSVANKVKGFDQNSNAGAMQIYNCTSYLNGSNYGFYNNNGYSLIIKNSISLPSSISNSFSGGSITTSNNTWLSGYSCTTNDFLSVDTTLILTARNADGSLQKTNFLRLVQGISLIDKGVNVEGIDYNGNAPDLGCFESNYQTSDVESEKIDSEKDTGGINIYDINGRLVGVSSGNKIDTVSLADGLYILSSVNTHKYINKIFKH